MKKLKLEIELTYDDELMHSGDSDPQSKAWFTREVLLKEEGGLILHSNEIGDEVGEVRVLSISNVEEGAKGRLQRASARYVERMGHECPFCGSREVESSDNYASDQDWIRVPTHCWRCCFEWTEVYLLSRIAIHNKDVEALPSEL